MKPSLFLRTLLAAWALALGGPAPAATFTVVNNAATGPGSLHQAILDANANPGPDVIAFNIAGANRTITPPAASPLPVITDPVTIDGTTQPGFAGVPLVELNGASGPAASTGLHLATSNCVIRGLVINRWKAHGIRLEGGGGHVIEGCYLGVSLAGTADQGNTLHGVFIENSAGNRVGGPTAAQRNVISGNDQHGIRVQGAAAAENLIQGNIIGLNAAGTGALRNTQHGIAIEDAADTQVGGPGAGEGNVISGNGQHGVFLGAGTARTLVRGNLIGLSADGATRQSNSQDGVHLAGATGTVIGGTAAGAGNTISGNGGDGLELGPGTADTQILGNVIGLRPAGDAIAHNANRGVFVNGAVNTRIGGSDAGAGNVISGNTQHGIAVAGASTAGVVIQGNLIGPDAGGTLDLGNTQDGINVAGGSGVVVGGTTAGARNVISGNNGEGIELAGAGVADVVIEGNFIGTDRAGAAALGNSSHGVLIAGATRSRVGGVAAGQANRIAFNGGDGVFISGGVENPVRGNSIHSNVGLGIDLGANGVTNNDPTDADTGANQLQNFPVLGEAILRTAATEVRGSLQTSANGTFTLDFYANDTADPTGHGEGEVWLGAVNVTTDAAGFAAFTANVAATGLRFISATATDAAGNTSEFSATRRAVTTAAPADFVVTTAADSGPGSLRQAILDANAALNEGDRIVFNIAGDGPHTIAPVAALPALAAPVTLDGYTQPGAQPNTLAEGFNAALRVVLDGNAAPNNTDGLRIEAPRVTVRGLALTRWKSDGVEILAAAGGAAIEGCVIGLGPDGSRQGQNAHGIHVAGSSGNRLGGSVPAQRNVISGNGQHGIFLTGAGARDNVVEGNFIGTGLDGATREGNSQDGVQIVGGAGNRIGGTAAGAGNVIGGNSNDGIEIQNANGTVIQGNRLGVALNGAETRNGFHGVHLNNTSDTLIGGAAAGAGNVIARNGGRGVVVVNNASLRNVIRGNSIFANGSLGIDLANNGVTQNDAGDADTGPNGFQNFPVITGALAEEAATRLTGTFNSKAGAAFTLEFFSSTAADPSGFGEGEQFLGAAEVTTDAEGNAAFDLTLPVRAVGRAITATATGAEGTSEFSAVRRADSTVPGRTFTVTTAADAGPGSLRQALLDADAVMTGPPHRIVFNIPGDGPHTILPASALPVPASEPVLIDGFTQPGASANTLPAGFNAVHRVILDGTAAPFGAPGLRFDTPGNTVRGLVIVSFKEEGVRLRGDGNAVEGCLLGVMPDGAARPNGSGGVRTEAAAAGSRIGGTAPAARNVIAGNSQSNVILDSTGAAEVLGNWIGLTPAGNAAPASAQGFLGTTAGVEILRGADHAIGGAAPGAGNVIGGHLAAGVLIRNAAASRVRVLGNRIGTDAAGVAPVPNGLGIEVSNSSDNVLGGVLPGEGNLIAFNTGVGVRVAGFAATERNAIRGNRIFGNTGIGIDLGFDGVTPNDPEDTDDGPNRSQNFPVLTAATATAGSVAIAGTMNTVPERTYTLDFFANALCDPRGHGQGGQYLGSTTVATDAGGLGTFNVTLPATITGRFLTATATDPDGNTSEFSACLEAATDFPAETFTVTTAADAGPGSLREAIERNNLSVAGGRNRIVFAIPGDGPHVITPATPLPPATHAVELDGYSQPGARPNALAAGSDAVIRVRLDRGPTSGFQGLVLAGADSIVRGLAFTGWFQALELRGERHAVLGCFFGLQPDGTAGDNTFGIFLASGGADHRVGSPAPADRNVVGRSPNTGLLIEGGRGARVEGNLFGLTPAGDPAPSGVAISVIAGTDHRIGGPVPGAGNVVAHASREGILVRTAEGTVIQGNLIGTDPAGLAARGNQTGLQLEVSARNTLVGGPAPGARNVISGNQNVGLIAGQDAVIQGNFIGVGADGVTPLGNAIGVFINGSGNRLGGTAAGEGNVIAHHALEGVRIVAPDAVRNAVRGNRIFGNAGLGIDLGPFGITPNDPLDADTGPNQLQNFPVITAGSQNPATVQVAGVLESRPDTAFALDFFANPAPHGSGAGEGGQYLGSGSVTTGADGRGVFDVTLPAVGVGRFLTATATDPDGNTSEFSLAFRAGSTLPPQTFTVTTVDDDGPGSLRQALRDLGGRSAGAAHLIRFAIPGEGVRTIALQSPLPDPGEPFLLDGFTQAGTSPNTAADADNAVRLVRLDGAALNLDQPVLRLTRAGSGARGLIVSGGRGAGVELAGEGGHTVAGCLIIGNGTDGLRIANSAGNRVGGAAPADRNLIVNQNAGSGIQVGGPAARDNRILGNFLGVEADGVTPARNFDGVLVDDGGGLEIGGAAPGEGNVIAFHRRSGVVVRGGTGTVLRGNRIFGNQSLGVDLAPIGVTANDPDDADDGPNGLQNFPVIEAAEVVAAGTRLRGTLNSRPQAAFLLEFFHNDACHFSNHGQGARPVATTTVTTDAQGNAAFDFTIAQALPRGVVTATATGDQGTSEFSACRAVETTLPPRTFTVTTPDDDGPGSLRQAIRDANAAFTTGRSTIAFNLPGPGVRMIQPLGPLPEITGPTLVDGFTQPGAAPDTTDATLKHVLRVRLDGERAGPGAHGLSVSGRPVEIRGLMITRFDGAGVAVSGPLGQVDVQGCWIGTDGVTGVGPQAPGGRPGGPSLQRAPANPDARTLGNGAGLAQTGGVLNIQNSVISGNQGDGVFQTGGQLFADSTFFGVDPSGESPLGNGRDGIRSAGGITEILDSVLSGNTRHGLSAGGDTPGQPGPPNLVEIRHSFLGTSPLAVRSTGNGGAGLHVQNVSPASRLVVLNNSIGGNSGPGIFLGNGLQQGQIFNNGIGVGPRERQPGQPLDFFTGHTPEPNLGPGILVDGAPGASPQRSGTFGRPDLASGVGMHLVSNIQIGGPGQGEANLFKHNARTGILVRNAEMISYVYNVFGLGQLPVNESALAAAIITATVLDNFIRYFGQFSPLVPPFTTGAFLHLLTPDPQNPDCLRPASETPVTPAGDGSFTVDVSRPQPPPSNVAGIVCDPSGNCSSGLLTPLTPQVFDFGDAPDSYRTLLASDGPRHPETHDLMVILGSRWTSEPDGRPGPGADGDGPSDDGVALPGSLVPGTTATIGVALGFLKPLSQSVPEGWVIGWIDFNGDGRFDNPGERVFQEWVVGTASIPVRVPADAKPGRTYARFRVSSMALLDPFGPAPDGEVEDYAVVIGPDTSEPIRIFIVREGVGANLTVLPATKAVIFEATDKVTGQFRPLNQTPATKQRIAIGDGKEMEFFRARLPQ